MSKKTWPKLIVIRYTIEDYSKNCGHTYYASNPQQLIEPFQRHNIRKHLILELIVDGKHLGDKEIDAFYNVMESALENVKEKS